MSKLVWDNVGERYYETGVQECALYVKGAEGKYGNGVAWNGITAITESPSGAEATPLYADNTKYLNLTSNEEFGATIEAYTYPDEFGECDGSAELVASSGIKVGQQTRKEFGLCYKTLMGNDTRGKDLGYKLHLVYNCLAAPSEKAYATVNDSPEAITFSWEVSTTPVSISKGTVKLQPTAHIEIDSTKCSSENLTKLENLLYGTAEKEPTLPTPDEIIDLINAAG